ncbi:ArsR/SmtB family transcription factor [Actinoplanes sp. NPDC020271]|uniref:ArsR/SmtB family transcription factor n=1 Tax=Actinoplanes sp. NPDC020271 TaxID=3363896 RepID=UPI00378A6E54
MSLGEDRGQGDQASLRALAHPVRLRMLSLLTGAEMTAAELARQLGITHANASYHLRNLLAAGLIGTAGKEKIRGGLAKKYRYDSSNRSVPFTREQAELFYPAAASELRRRAGQRRPGGIGVMGDAEVWIDPAVWSDVRERIAAALHDLHDAARPPDTPGTVRTSTTVALFEMERGGR